MKFTKQIVRPGKYLVRTPDGRRREEEISSDRIKGWTTRFAEMLKEGLHIPAPWRHDDKALPLTEEQLGSNHNAGWWSKLWQEPDGTLYGELEVPRDEDASRVGTTVIEVSPYVREEWKDGSGKSWNDSILHLALVTHPVVKNQENFQPVSSVPAMALSLSQLIEAPVGAILMQDAASNAGIGGPANASGASIRDALAALKAVGLDLPEDTSAENLIERIIVASRAIAAKGEEDIPPGKEQQPGKGTKEQPVPIAMGDITLGDTDMTDEQKKAFQLEKKKQEEAVQRAKEDKEKAIQFAIEQVHSGYKARVKALVETGRITPHFVKERLEPMAESFQLSLDEEGKQVQQPLDIILEALEALPENSIGLGKISTSRKAKKAQDGSLLSFEEPLPPGMEGREMPTEEEADKLAEKQLERINR